MDGSGSASVLAGLEKRLRLGWSSWSAAPSLSPAALEAAAQGVDSMDRITKIRLLLALLGLDPSRRAASAVPLRRLLQSCAKSTEEWVPIIAGIVERQIFPGSQEDGSAAAPVAGELESAVERVVSKLIGHMDAAEGSERAMEHVSFAPFEDKYCVSGEARKNALFTYTKKSPDFLSRDGSSTGSGTAAGGQSVRRAAPPSLLLGSGHRQQQASAPSSSSLSAERSGAPRGLLSSSIRGARQEERKGPIMIPIAQIKQLEASRAEPEKKKRAAVSGDSEPKKRAKTDATTSSTTAASATDSGECKADAAAPEAKAVSTQDAPAADTSSSTSSSALPPLIISGPRTPPMPPPPPSMPLISTATATEAGVPAPAALSEEKAPSTGMDIAAKSPSSAAPSSSPATADKPNPQRASLGSGVLDLQALFADSPLLPAEARHTIERFFAENWAQHFPDSNQVLKFSLKSEEKTLEDGSRVRETIFLKLQCSNHSWSKTKRSAKITAAAESSKTNA